MLDQQQEGYIVHASFSLKETRKRRSTNSTYVRSRLFECVLRRPNRNERKRTVLNRGVSRKQELVILEESDQVRDAALARSWGLVARDGKGRRRGRGAGDRWRGRAEDRGGCGRRGEGGARGRVGGHVAAGAEAAEGAGSVDVGGGGRSRGCTVEAVALADLRGGFIICWATTWRSS